MLVTSVQRFCMHDGPGIRTVIFTKGCTLRCRWCHNPETQSKRREILFYETKCVGCGGCAAVCEKHAQRFGDRRTIDRELCTACGKCADVCPTGALEPAGRFYSLDELLETVRRDRDFYGADGGVTLSGGEPMLYDEAPEFLARCADAGINTAVETCGQFDPAAVDRLAGVCDLLLFDVKDTDSERLRLNTGGSLELILGNFRKADRLGIKSVMRCIIIGGVNDNEEHYRRLAEIFNELKNCLYIELLPYHEYGCSKSLALGREYETFGVPDSGTLEAAARLIRQTAPVKLRANIYPRETLI